MAENTLQDFGYMYDDFGNLAARTDNKNMEERFTYDIPTRPTATAVVVLSHRGSRVGFHAAAAMRQPYRSTVAGEVCYTYKTAMIAAGGLAGGVSPCTKS